MTQYHSLKQHSSQATNSKSLVIPTSDMSLPTSATSLLAPPPTPTPAFGINQAQKSQNLMIGAATNDLNEVCYNFVLQSVVYNCASPISNKLLVRPSIINAPVQLSAKNSSSSSSSKISLPSISELDCMIDNTPRTGDQMMRAMDSTRHANKWFAPHPPPPVISTTTSNSSSSSNTSPITQYRATKSNNPQINRNVDRTINTNKRPLKRQKTLSNKPGSSGSSTTFPTKKQQQNQCHSCKSTETPEWRRGPLGPRTLCNACGLIWTKLCKQEDDNSRRKLKNKHHHHRGSTSTTSPPVMMEDSSSSSLGKTHQYGKLDLAFLLS